MTAREYHNWNCFFGWLGISVAIFFITGRPAYAFLSFFIPSAIGNACAWLIAVSDEIKRGVK